MKKSFMKFDQIITQYSEQMLHLKHLNRDQLPEKTSPSPKATFRSFNPEPSPCLQEVQHSHLPPVHGAAPGP